MNYGAGYSGLVAYFAEAGNFFFLEEFLYDDAYLKKLYEQDTINTQYIHSIFCEEYEKNLLDGICQK